MAGREEHPPQRAPQRFSAQVGSQVPIRAGAGRGARTPDPAREPTPRGPPALPRRTSTFHHSPPRPPEPFPTPEGTPNGPPHGIRGARVASPGHRDRVAPAKGPPGRDRLSRASISAHKTSGPNARVGRGGGRALGSWQVAWPGAGRKNAVSWRAPQRSSRNPPPGLGARPAGRGRQACRGHPDTRGAHPAGSERAGAPHRRPGASPGVLGWQALPKTARPPGPTDLLSAHPEGARRPPARRGPPP